MCASFSGERGEQQAKVLANELRKNHNMAAYLYHHNFDYTQTYEGQGWERYINPDTGEEDYRQPQMRANNARVQTEVAVVVGDFPSIEDSRAQKTLKRIKYMKPRTIEVAEHIDTEQRYAGLKNFLRQFSKDEEEKAKGPMKGAFLMPNPLLPDEYFNKDVVDKFILKLNSGIKHSLLDCPKPYSVQVASFRGKTTFDLKEIEEEEKANKRLLNFGGNVRDSKLAEAAAKAHLLTLVLRKKGIEAYEFHDRYESLVCVGSFDWTERKRPDGRIQTNPYIAQLILDYKGEVQSFPGMPAAVKPKTLPELRGKGIFFDVQPIPVQVPKRPSKFMSQ